MVQMRLISSCLLAVAGMEDEYYHTQLLQTKLAVEDKKLHSSGREAANATKFLEKSFMLRLSGPDRSCAEEPECEKGCKLHYEKEPNQEACMSCIDQIMDKDSELYLSEDEMMDKFINEGPDAAIQLVVGAVTSCTGEDDLISVQCPDEESEYADFFACVTCANTAECTPTVPLNDCGEVFDQCVDSTLKHFTPEPQDGPGDGSGEPQEGGPPELIQRKKKDDDEGMCILLWEAKEEKDDEEDVTIEECKLALDETFTKMHDPEVSGHCMTPGASDECFTHLFLGLMRKKLGYNKCDKACIEEIGTDVNFERCYEEGAGCASCEDITEITDECKKCVIKACEESDDDCKRSEDDDALILAQKKLAMNKPRSLKTVFMVAHAKASLEKMIMSFMK